MNELIIYGGVSFAFAAGWAFRAYTMPPLCVFDWRTVAGENHRKFVDACKQCNTIEGELDEALASNRRLTDALQAKNERLERIVEAFADQKSGTAQKAVKLSLTLRRRKQVRIVEQQRAKQAYWTAQRKAWAQDPLRGAA